MKRERKEEKEAKDNNSYDDLPLVSLSVLPPPLLLEIVCHLRVGPLHNRFPHFPRANAYEHNGWGQAKICYVHFR